MPDWFKVNVIFSVSSLAASLTQVGSLFGGSNVTALALPVLFFIALYVLMILPNQRKQKAWGEMLAALKTGDRVTTSGGLRGTILQVKDDCVIVRVQPDGLKMEFVKSAIAAVTTAEEKA